MMFSIPGQQHGHHPSTKHATTNGGSPSSDAVYDAKFKILTRKCLQVKEETDRIYCNLLRSKKLLRRLLHERRLLAERLERYGDQFCDVDLPKFCDEDFTYELLISQKKSVHEATSPATPSSLGSASTSVSRRGSSSSQPVQQTPPLLAGSFFDNVDPASSTAKTKKKSTSGTPRAKKDPEAPRKPVNAYFIFCERRRADVQRQMVEERQGDVDRKEVTRKLSQLWLDLPQEEKKTFYTLYEIEKSRYDAEMKEYSATRQPICSSSSSTVLMGLPPPFPSAEEDVLLSDQPAAKRPKKASVSRNGPGRPPLHQASGMATPTIHSNDCSPVPSNNNDNSNICLATDALLTSAANEPNVVIAVDESQMNHHQSSSEDVFLLPGDGDGMECLGLPLASEAVGDTLLLSSTTTGDESSGESGAGVGGLVANGNGGPVSEHHSSSTSPHSGTSQPIVLSNHHQGQQGIILDRSPQQLSPPTISSEWQVTLPVTVVACPVTEEEGDNNTSSTLNASSSSTLSPSNVTAATTTGSEPGVLTAMVENESAMPIPEQTDLENVKNESAASSEIFEDAQQNIVKEEKEAENPKAPEQESPEKQIVNSTFEEVNQIEEKAPAEEVMTIYVPAFVEPTESETDESSKITGQPTLPSVVSTEISTSGNNLAAEINVADIPLPPEPPASTTYCFGSLVPPPPPPPTC